MSSGDERLESERTLIGEAKGKGPLATLLTYVRLSGPGWLQSAITLEAARWAEVFILAFWSVSA